MQGRVSVWIEHVSWVCMYESMFILLECLGACVYSSVSECICNKGSVCEHECECAVVCAHTHECGRAGAFECPVILQTLSLKRAAWNFPALQWSVVENFERPQKEQGPRGKALANSPYRTARLHGLSPSAFASDCKLQCKDCFSSLNLEPFQGRS